MITFDEILSSLGYSLEDDSWDTDGRKTWSHDSDATAPYLRSLHLLLRPFGFVLDTSHIRALSNADANELVEIEPGGFECPGHLLHLIRITP